LAPVLLCGADLTEPPYVGKWAAADASCDGDTVVLEDQALYGAENQCQFEKVKAKNHRYAIQALCRAEGLPQEVWKLIIEMAGEDGLILTRSDGIPTRYKRCPE